MKTHQVFHEINFPRFKVKKSKCSQTAVQYQEKEGNLYQMDEWRKTMDCDYLLSIELEEWPVSAAGWVTLSRHWPELEVSLSI